MDPVTAAAISAGAQVMNTATQYGMNALTNRKARKHEKAMLDYINRYNTPANQAKRLIAGGFNPHLVYGNGSIANTSAPSNVPNVAETPAPDFGAAISSYNDLTMNDSQRRNTDTATETMAAQSEADLKLKAAQTAESIGRTAVGAFDLDFRKEMRETQKDAMRESLRTAQLGNDTTETNLKTLGARNQADLDLARSQIATAVKQRRGMDLANKIAEIHYNMWKRGQNPNDPAWQRQVGQWVTPETLDEAKKIYNKMKALRDTPVNPLYPIRRILYNKNRK